MKKMEKPTIEIVAFEKNDVIVTSVIPDTCPQHNCPEKCFICDANATN